MGCPLAGNSLRFTAGRSLRKADRPAFRMPETQREQPTGGKRRAHATEQNRRRAPDFMDATLKEPQAQRPPDGACRQNAKGVLRDKIARLRRAAADLQVLHDTLPEKLTPEQDDAIWNLATSLLR